MISRVIRTFIANAVAFLAAGYFLPGFHVVVMGNIPAFLALIAVFTLINLIIYPIIRLILTPIVLLTLGLFTLVIHAGILYIIDIYSVNITIDGLTTLLYATIIITVVNIVFHTGSKLFGSK
jgi:putative membrane protein